MTSKSSKSIPFVSIIGAIVLVIFESTIGYFIPGATVDPELLAMVVPILGGGTALGVLNSVLKSFFSSRKISVGHAPSYNIRS